MRPLRYSINVSLDGCCDHQSMIPDEELHRRAAEFIARADALIFGRITYQLMEAGWRPLVESGTRPDWVADWMIPFAETIHAAKKYVVSDTLETVDWNAELVRVKDIETTVRGLREQSGEGLATGGVMLPQKLAELGLIDEYEFVMHPRIVGHGRTLFTGLSKPLDLTLVDRLEYGSGAVAMRYVPKR
ncbi:dihydrofolate reductase family protein [Devosia sp.]|jgi:dihydrofolate reductase|uniref:dihydrofolate reductase family protein n=1 Tax=Devosia sp. TaxID=1871048 RepID=UPI001AC99FEE|nr:dihydrofolate reductase family protein [Devosia sp.]MBN9332564.1 dihydrofolate reductase family protein [Devosia sp.]